MAAGTLADQQDPYVYQPGQVEKQLVHEAWCHGGI